MFQRVFVCIKLSVGYMHVTAYVQNISESLGIGICLRACDLKVQSFWTPAVISCVDVPEVLYTKKSWVGPGN